MAKLRFRPAAWTYLVPATKLKTCQFSWAWARYRLMKDCSQVRPGLSPDR